MSSRRGRTSTTSRIRSRRTPTRLTVASAATCSPRPSRWARCRIQLRRATGATSRWGMTGATGAGLPSGRRTARGTSGSTATRCRSAAPRSARGRTARARATAIVDLAFPTQYTTDNWGVEGGYQSGKATFAVRWDYSKFHNDNETLRWTNPFFGQNQLDSSYLPPGNDVQQVHALRQLPRPAVAVGRVGALHVVEDDERRRARAERAEHRRDIRSDAAAGRRVQRREHQPVVRAVLDRGADHQRRHSRVLLLDQAREQLDHRRVRQRADAAVGERPRLRQPHRGERLADADRRQLRQRALQLHQEQRRLRRVVEVRARQPVGRRLGLQRPRPDPVRLRQVALEQILGRVQEHDARHGLRPAQVPVRQARLDVQPEQRRDRCRTIPITCCGTPRRSTCRATRPTS